MPFEHNVFVNCPFDDDYTPIIRAVLFCIIDLGFEPRIALERLDSSEPRIEKILSLIRDSKYGIHDLSRLQAESAGEYYRLNMPFELGLDVGCRRFKGGRWGEKRCLILEAKPYRYQAALSDLSNSDIAVHKGEPREAIRHVRNWLNAQARLSAPGPARVWSRFTDFMAWHYDALEGRGFSPGDIEQLPIDELMVEMRSWRQQTLVPTPRR